MQQLQDVVDGKERSGAPPRDEVVFLYDEIVKGLRLTTRRNPRSPMGTSSWTTSRLTERQCLP